MSEGTAVRRFSDLQVYVHLVVAASILWLLLTGMAITFAEYLPWIPTILGYGNLVLVHVIGGVVLVLGGIYYAVYALTGLLTGEFPTAWLPDRHTVREAVEHFKFILGRAPKPDAGKYTFIQKSEIAIVLMEVTVLSITGLLLWHPGILLAVKPAFLIGRDVHAVVAFTLLIGITYHLFDTHVETFPLDRTIFTGKIDAEEAAEQYPRWADDATRADGGATATRSRLPPDALPVSGIVLAMATFALVYLAIMLGAVLSPLPTGQYVIAQFDGGVLSSPLGWVFAVWFNVIALVLIASIVALGYGMYTRYTEDR